MGRSIIWKNQPIQRVREVANYLTHEFSVGTADKFLDSVADKVDWLADYPTAGYPTRFKTVRRVRVGKHYSLFYRVMGAKFSSFFSGTDGKTRSKTRTTETSSPIFNFQ